MDNIKTWTGLSVEESIRMTEDSDKWRKYVWCGQLSDRGRLKNRTELVECSVVAACVQLTVVNTDYLRAVTSAGDERQLAAAYLPSVVRATVRHLARLLDGDITAVLTLLADPDCDAVDRLQTDPTKCCRVMIGPNRHNSVYFRPTFTPMNYTVTN